ncbi:CoA transferase [Frankia sp. AgB1.9]|uniref:CaiB/BaiF CoA transferase family protein n=1 Tax=Frankia sp. AgB1.8 TaxID=2792839 RepID=UPI001EE4B12C|nr:CoA transferase [Frankia sp. AgW1.1]MBL7549820.1 CoA transferase [Frankia sp. AgB1.9]
MPSRGDTAFKRQEFRFVNDVLAGIKVIEVAGWTFVPSAGAVLAEWGADVIKVEPLTGDPQRGLVTSGLVPAGAGGVNYMMEVPNRGKRSIGLNLATAGGRDLLLALVRQADVFLTSYLPQVRKKLGIDVDDLRAVNPDVIYVRGSGYGPRGPDVDTPAFDGVTYWARGGVASALTPPEAEFPVGGRPAFGDVMGGMALAGGISAALLARERNGVASVVDVSLLGLALWNLGPDVAASKLYEGVELPSFRRDEPPNPLVSYYRTGDDRQICLMMLQSDRYWPDLCRHLGLDGSIADPRYADAAARFQNRAELYRLLAETFASRTYAQWVEALATLAGPWSGMQTAAELHDDPAALANGYLPTLTATSGAAFELAANPVQFDETPASPSGAPEHGQHTEEILLDLGLGWDDIDRHKQQGDIL